MVSSPGDGGLVYLEADNQVVLSYKSTTGIYVGTSELMWAPQEKGGRYLLNSKDGLAKLIEISSAPLDLHDVLIAEGNIYLAATQNNEVICLDRNYTRLESWRLPGEEDSSHLNSITIYQGQLIASIFGSFTRYRQYKDGTSGLGKIYNVRTGETLIDGLSQPHSLTVAGDLLYFCSSQEKKLHVYDGKRIIETIILPGYARGVAVGKNCIYVGISLSRNINDELHELTSGAISIIDIKSMKCIGLKLIPFREVYDIRILSSHTNLLSLTATQEAQLDKLNQTMTVYEKQIDELNQSVAAQERLADELKQTIAVREKQIDEIKTSTSWSITRPIRYLGQLLHQERRKLKK